MADVFKDYKAIVYPSAITVKETVTMDGAAATWYPKRGKVLFAGYVVDSGTGGGSITWTGRTVSLAGWTGDEVMTLYALCSQSYSHEAL